MTLYITVDPVDARRCGIHAVERLETRTECHAVASSTPPLDGSTYAVFDGRSTLHFITIDTRRWTGQQRNMRLHLLVVYDRLRNSAVWMRSVSLAIINEDLNFGVFTPDNNTRATFLNDHASYCVGAIAGDDIEPS